MESEKQLLAHLTYIGDSVVNVAGSDTAMFARSDSASASFSLVKDNVAAFVEHSTLVVHILDEVAKIHPFVSGKYQASF